MLKPEPAPVSRDPYGVALRALRQLAAERHFAPGEALVITELADRLGLSPTPLREALACLAGEGLIVRQKGKGYVYPADPAPILLDLYGLQRAYVHSALTLYFTGAGALQKAGSRVGDDPDAADVYGAVVGQSGNAALIDAHERVSRRLAAPERLDRSLDPETAALIGRMAAAIREGVSDGLLALVDMHHRSRCARAWRVARSLECATAA